jgi:serine/threonine protein kinase
MRLGPYEILSPIGAGGMGEVYKARDTKLGRNVAIKVLPEAFAQDNDRLARFEREARILASLNHPNIASLHGFEESGGKSFLVMELVEGTTLAERIYQGPLSVEEALPLFTQITKGLETAHEIAVVHRDLKLALPASLGRCSAGSRDFRFLCVESGIVVRPLSNKTLHHRPPLEFAGA